MKLATLKTGRRDGELAVVSHDLTRAVKVGHIAPTLQAALDDWPLVAPALERAYAELNAGGAVGSLPFDEAMCHSPLPRSYLWCEGTVYLVHLERCRRATNRDLPQALYTEASLYQGGSDSFIGPRDPIEVVDQDWDVDLEAGICAILDDVPMGTPVEQAARYIRLLLLTNDVSLRRIQPAEMAKGLGLLQCKPANSFSPVAVAPDTLGSAWTGTMLARPVRSYVNGELIGDPVGSDDYYFDFPQLISHLARTRHIEAGAIVGVGTVANRDESRGVSCILEKRAKEILSEGAARTPYLKYGDRVRIECLDTDGQSIFGAIDQEVIHYSPPS